MSALRCVYACVRRGASLTRDQPRTAYTHSNQERKQKKSKKTAKATLSFAMDDEEEGDDAPVAKRAKKSAGEAGARTNLKNPNVDTSFLPDRAREEREAAEREALRREWLEKQDALKKEEVEITYSYWDGTGHRRTVQVSCVLLCLPLAC